MKGKIIIEYNYKGWKLRDEQRNSIKKNPVNLNATSSHTIINMMSLIPFRCVSKEVNLLIELMKVSRSN